MKKTITPLFLPFLVTISAISGLFLYFFPRISQIPETYHDIIIEHTARNATNKSAELTLFWLLCLAGAILIPTLTVLLSLLFKKLPMNHEFLRGLVPSNWKERVPKYLFIFLLPNILHILFYGTYSLPLLFGTLLYILTSFLIPKYHKEIVLLFIFSYYFMLSLCTLFSHFTIKANLSSSVLYLTSGIFATLLTILCLLLKKADWLRKLILLMQLSLPFLFVVYLIDTYEYLGSFLRVPYAKGYYLFIYTILILFFLYTLLHSLQRFSITDGIPVKELICKTSVMIIFVYNSFSAAPLYAQPDQHHHGEQLIPWQQIITLGQTAYKDYTPVSGLFPMVNGTIQHLLLNGTVSDYSPAISLMMLLFCIITSYLIYKHIGGLWSLAISILFCLPSYNRQYMVLPVLLLLTLPALVKKKNLWLQLWIACCFLAGLYYPLYGAALLLGTFPFAIYQFFLFLKSDCFIMQRKKISFYISWLIIFIPIIISAPLLFRMLNHTLTFSSQTILADGISLFGQSVPAKFMPYLSVEKLRYVFYFSLRFLLPAFAVWCFVYLLFVLFFKKKTDVIYNVNELKSLYLGIISAAITLCISYTYTLVRADIDVILSRTAHILIPILGIFLPVLLLSYAKDIFDSKLIITFVAVGFSLPLVLFTQVSNVKFPDMWIYPNAEANLIMDDGSKLYTYYKVPDNFVKMDESEINYLNTLGNGFMVNDQFHYILDYETIIKKCNAVSDDTYYMGFDGQGFYYYNNVKVCATGFIQAAKGYDAQQEILTQAKEKRPVIFLMEPQSTYYIYYWMMTSDYVYCKEDQCFYPKELFDKMYPDSTGDDYRIDCPATDFGAIPSSFGKSIDTLSPLFINKLSFTSKMKATTNTLTFDTPISGTDYDFIYLTLDTTNRTAQTITVTFETTDSSSFSGNSVQCEIRDGTLLLPMGMNAVWLLSDISSISISTNDGSMIPIQEMELQKIRQ